MYNFLQQSPPNFLELPRIVVILKQFVQNPINEVATLGRRIVFGDLDVFINGHFRRYRREVKEFSQRNFDQDHVEVSYALLIPVRRFLVYFTCEFIMVQHGLAKQFQQELLIVFFNHKVFQVK